MKKHLAFGTLLFLTILLGCKEKNVTALDTDNLFAFKEYIGQHTNGDHSVAAPIRIYLAKPLTQFEHAQEIPSDYLQIRPKVEGTLVVENGVELLFLPKETLRPDTVYEVTLLLDRLYENISPDFKKYTFSFRTIKPNFRIELGALQSHDKNWQYITGILEASDVLQAQSMEKVVLATQGDRKVSVKWTIPETPSTFFNFTIDSIQRQTEDSDLSITWNGNVIDVAQEGEETITIPGRNKFVVIDTKTTSSANTSLTLNFSEPLDPDQNLKGLVTVENAGNLRFEIDGSLLHIYPSDRVLGEVRVHVFSGIKSAYGFSLAKDFSEIVSFERLKPQVRLVSKGTILPNANGTPIYFETVNLNAVEVRVIQVFEDNMLQFLQYNDLAHGYGSDIRMVGRRVAYKVLPLTEGKKDENGHWRAHGLDLSDLIDVHPGSLYRVEFSFRKEHTSYTCEETSQNTSETIPSRSGNEEELEERYWDNEIYNWRRYDYNWEQRDNPCHPAYYNRDKMVSTNLLGSDMGLIVKKGNNGSCHFAATNLLTAQPEAGTTIRLFNFQQQPLGEVVTDDSGFALYDSEHSVAFAVAEKAGNYAYAKLADGKAISMSSFDVSGEQLQRGLQGFMFAERGVHRPGDPIHLTFVLNDVNNPLPENHPVELEVTDATGKLVQRTVLTQASTKVAEGWFAKRERDFYYFPVPTQTDAPTGNWNAKIRVGGAAFNKVLRIATVKPNRLKMAIDFDETLLTTARNAKGSLTAKWLHGAPARNLKLDIDAKLSVTETAFDGFKDYRFQDPVRSFPERELQFLQGTLDDDGHMAINTPIVVNGKAPGMLKATFTTKVFEGGGDFSIDVFSKNLAPYSHFVGLKSPEAKQFGSFFTDEANTFKVVSVNGQGKAIANRNLDIQVFKIEWRWWWTRGVDNLSRYENASVHRPYKEFSLTTDGDGKGRFTLNIPDTESGRYLIRVMDRASGHATGRTAYFYRNWWHRPTNAEAESSKILFFSSDKQSYETGEQAHITFPSDEGGRALLSIENGSEVLSQQWISTSSPQTKASIPITADMAPNVYVNISLLQPHGSVKNDLPIRLYGVVPLLVTDPQTVLRPELKMPDVLAPEETFSLSVAEAGDRPMTYSLAMVDDGLLDLTRFKTPDIHGAFYARQALGVKTFDCYDDVMGAYSVSPDNVYTIGGGGIAEGAKNRKAQRFKPVVKYLGPFYLAAGEKATHTITMPNYVGSVRTMVVAGNKTNAYSTVAKTTPVRKPLMVLTSLPRKLSPGETVTIPVTVFAMEKKIKNVRVNMDVGAALEPLGDTTKSIRFAAVGEQIVNFDFKVLPSIAPQNLKVTVSAAGESASSETEIAVENPNPITTKSTLYTLEGNSTQTVDFETFGTSGTNTATLELATLPPMDFSRRMRYLLNYPHGCLEQTTSSAFPQLFLADVADVTFDQKEKVEQNIKAAIRRLGNFQLPSGGLAYWPGAREESHWGTNYAGHFMLEAKKKGYQLPLTFLSHWIGYQKKEARQWAPRRYGYNTDLIQAYRLYTLALAQQPELAAMNRLREMPDLSNDAKWRLAAAYVIVGRTEAAQALIAKANIDIKPNNYNHYTYGSVFRNRSMALETLVLLGGSKQVELARSLAKRLSSTSWYSTQETAYALLALSKMALKNGGRSIQVQYSQNGKARDVKTSKAIVQRKLEITGFKNSLSLRNDLDNVVYATVIQSGKLPMGEELSQERKLTLNVGYTDPTGQKLMVTDLRQGTEMEAKITVYNTTNDAVENVALSYIVPSGWEIVNTAYTADGTMGNHADYTDIRDDRALYYFDLGARKRKTFTVKLNASYLGDYYLPGSQVEAMYDNTYYARNKGQWVSVRK